MDVVASHRPSRSHGRITIGNSSKFIQPRALILVRALGIRFVPHRAPVCGNPPCHFYQMIQMNGFLPEQTARVKVQIYRIYLIK